MRSARAWQRSPRSLKALSTGTDAAFARRATSRSGKPPSTMTLPSPLRTLPSVFDGPDTSREQFGRVDDDHDTAEPANGLGNGASHRRRLRAQPTEHGLTMKRVAMPFRIGPRLDGKLTETPEILAGEVAKME